MWLGFAKMNGAGNDFILIDNRAGQVCLTPAQVVRLCDRQRGIGADGLMLLVPCGSGRADWAWEFFNRDGSAAEMCGNGARCFAAFVRRVAGWDDGRPPMRIETGAGVIQAGFQGARVTVGLTPPRDVVLGRRVTIPSGSMEVHSVNTGVPHAVHFVADIAAVDVARWGAELRWHEAFKPSGTNVNFAQILAPGRIRVRTFERGVEGETLACGTGVTAAAVIASRVHGFGAPVQVQVQSEEWLDVSWVATSEGAGFEDVRLTGPADFVFEGRVEI